MSDEYSNPYSGYQGTPRWSLLDKALLQLAENRDLVETTSHEYIVGYLCKALAEPESTYDSGSSLVKRRAALDNIRKAVRAANTGNRDLVEELLLERRQEDRNG